MIGQEMLTRGTLQVRNYVQLYSGGRLSEGEYIAPLIIIYCIT